MNTTIVLNFIRSANAPQISAGVMMKNIPWKSMWVSRLIVRRGMHGNDRLAVFPGGLHAVHEQVIHVAQPFGGTSAASPPKPSV